MKRNPFLYLLLLLPLMAFTLKPISYSRTKVKVDHLLVLNPCSVVMAVNTNNEKEYSQALSEDAYNKFSAQLPELIPDTLHYSLYNTDAAKQSRIDSFVYAVSVSIDTKKEAGKYMLPDSLVQLFDTTKTNYVFCTMISGFERSEANMSHQYFKGKLWQFYSLGLFEITPYKASVTVTAFVLDLKNRNLLCFSRSIWPDQKPTDGPLMRRMFRTAFHNYFL